MCKGKYLAKSALPKGDKINLKKQERNSEREKIINGQAIFISGYPGGADL